jgi:hypothetical protein
MALTQKSNLGITCHLIVNLIQSYKKDCQPNGFGVLLVTKIVKKILVTLQFYSLICFLGDYDQVRLTAENLSTCINNSDSKDVRNITLTYPEVVI